MKRFSRIQIITFLILFLSFQSLSAKDYKLISPDGTIVLTISVTEKITYTLMVNGKQVMDRSFMSMTILDNPILGLNSKVIRKKSRSVNQILYPQLRVKSKEIQDNFNELELRFRGSYSIFFRAYNNGVAYRFKTKFKKDIVVKSEEAVFNFSKEAKVHFPRESEFFSHNERLYEYNALDTLTTKDLASLPLLVEPTTETKLLITETGLLDYPGMWVRGNTGTSLKATFPQYVLETKVDRFERWKDDRSIKPTKTGDYIAKTKGSRTFPWRVIAVSKKDADLITNQLTYQLADIDFASKYGIEYIILDEGWYVLGDVLKIVPEVDVKEIIRYGKAKNVDIILWVAWSSLNQKLEETLDAYQKWGVKGIKVDFMQRDDQWMVKYYERVAEACAKRELLVDFHGSYKPSGLRRTYPNVLTREGVKGAENNKWAKYITPKHNLTLPFIRMVAGPMDYTPGAMVNAQKKNFAIHWNRPMAMGTRAHQIAMYTLYESPLQMLSDSPSNYIKEEESTKYIAQIPTVWDETKVLHAKIGEYLAVARKNKNKWFVGVMNDETARELKIDFSFLKEGTYTVEIFKDGMNADRYASDYKLITKQITNNDVISAKLAPGGGWNAIISPKY